MRLFNFLFSLASIMAVAVADSPNSVITPGIGDNVYAGKDLSITWNPSTSGPVTLTLRFGAADSLSRGTEIASESHLNSIFG